MSEQLRIWLTQQLNRLNWSHRELARQTGLSQSIVSKTLSGERNVSADFCIKVAQALDETPEQVLRLASILPPLPSSENATLQELIEFAQKLSPEDRQDLIDYARFKYQKRKE